MSKRILRGCVGLTVVIACLGCARPWPKDVKEAFVNNRPNDVCVHWNGISMPIGKIWLAKINAEYYAAKFSKEWSENDGEDRYTTYVVCAFKKYNDNNIVKVACIEGTATLLQPRGISYHLQWNPGNPSIRFGQKSLRWHPGGYVGFYSDLGSISGIHSTYEGEGVEFAPTPWNDMEAVNFNDNRLKWYGFERHREKIYMPSDEIFG